MLFHAMKANFTGFKRVNALALICVLLATAGAAFWEHDRRNEIDQRRFAVLTERLRGEIIRRIAVYRYGLYGTRSVFAASKSVERDEFLALVNSRDLPLEFPGTLGIGYIEYVPRDNIQDFLARTRGDNTPDFEIQSNSTAKDLMVIKFIEPIAANRPSLGLDVGQEQNRREAAMRAARTGEASITKWVTLIQVPNDGPAFLFFLPVYHKEMPIETEQQREAAIEGWVYMPLVASRVFSGAANETDGELDFEVFEGEAATKQSLIYDNTPSMLNEAPGHQKPKSNEFSAVIPIEIGGQQWTISMRSTAKFLNRSSAVAWLIWVVGVLMAGSAWALFAFQRANLLNSKARELTVMAEMARVGSWRLEFPDFGPPQVFWDKEVRAIHEVDSDYDPSLRQAVDFYDPENRKRIEELIYRSREFGEPFAYEMPLTTAKGRMIWIKSLATPIYDKGRVVKLIGAFQEITEHHALVADLQESMGRTEQALKAKGEFLAMMSHEIRTPMNGVIGIAALLGETTLTDEQKDLVRTIEVSGQALLTMINDVLDASKIEAGKLVLEKSPFNLIQTVDEVKALFAEQAKSKNIEFKVTLLTEVPTLLIGDGGRIRQILLNLVGNALKFTERGTVELKIETTERTPGIFSINFAVQDTGIGIPEHILGKLFTPFTQADATMARKYGGTGLGLSICRRLVGMMDGKIDVASEFGHGSVFSFTIELPRYVKAKYSSPSDLTKRDVNDRALNVLVAEDNVINRKIAISMLEKLGCNVSIACDGEEALSRATNEQFDMIFMDWQMQKIDGLEVTRRIRSQASPVVIVAMTANAMEGDRAKCLEAGMNDYLSKPLEPKKLKSVVEFWGEKSAQSP